jgi:ATP-dependent helicase/nuclease subunit A
MSSLIDQAERDRFIHEQTRNISVIAPAGVGKTTAIVNRIVHLATLPEAIAVDRLARLIVVTYSVRAAQQMQQKARVAIRAAAVSARVQRAFQQTFFGTIHSYCVRLLDRFGHYLGLPSPVGLLQDDSDLWNRFLLKGLGPEISREPKLRELFHFYPPNKLYALGKNISPGGEIPLETPPIFDWRRLLDYRDNTLHHGTKASIARAQRAAVNWGEAWARGEGFRSLPKCPESDKAAAFAEVWDETFAPLHDWLRHAALAFGRRVANAYEKFRLSEAVMTYDDQVRLASRVLEHPAVRIELAAERLSVLLDEAQDTDPRQFDVLRRVAGLGDNATQADDQSFCIVGDFQQAIYAPRSDLGVYRRVHEEISAEPRGTSSRLQVTFRCDRAIIDFVNGIFPSILNDTAGQCAFETLIARDEAGAGQVVRWKCPDVPEDEQNEKKITAEVRAQHEARRVARQIRRLGLAGLGASNWSQVAILCPRKKWLLEIQRELFRSQIPAQLHSSNEEQRDRTPTAWLTALIWIAVHPEDSFEIAGVLREIMGVSDSDMALFTDGDGDRLRLDLPPTHDEGPVGRALGVLRDAFGGVDGIPMHRAVRQILDETHLRKRLEAVAELAGEEDNRELDDLVDVVAQRSAEGATLAGLAEELRLGLAQGHAAEEEIRDAVQLLTSHKAKGLEWRVVIVPYVFRTIESKATPYPRVVTERGGSEMVCRDKVDFERQARDYVSGRERQQLQRLLYVMATRAKQTLIFVDDEDLFSGKTQRPGSSAGELLNLGFGGNRAIWSALPEMLSLPDELFPPELPQPEPGAEIPALPLLSSEEIALAIEHASQFPRRITPHTLARPQLGEAEPETRVEQEEDVPRPAAEGTGVLYGTWWHEFVQTLPWDRPAEWQWIFDQAQPRSPQRLRAEREWELFRNSALARYLMEPGRFVQVEIPFLWRDVNQACLEGVMDLAVYTPGESAWNVIDWKTNRVDATGSAGLVETYREQIQAYVRALRAMLSAEVRGSLYLTQTGEWVPID